MNIFYKLYSYVFINIVRTKDWRNSAFNITWIYFMCIFYKNIILQQNDLICI